MALTPSVETSVETRVEISLATSIEPVVPKPSASKSNKATNPRLTETPWQVSTEDKEEISRSITQTWTDQAIKCYLTKAHCASCSIPRGNYSFTCQMNKVVPVLLETIGSPDAHRIEKILPYLHEG